MGNLADNAELRYTQSGQPVVTFRVATNSSYFSNGSRHERPAQFHPCVLWGKRGETLVQKECLLKGQPICVTGRLEHRTFTKQDGTKGYVSECIVGATDDSLILLGRGTQTQPGPADLPAPSDDDAPPPDFSE
jgi:single-strand DNA-binding protein